MKMTLDKLLLVEEKLIIDSIYTKYRSVDDIKPFSPEELNDINQELHLTSIKNIAFLVHGKIINSLAYSYLACRFPTKIEELKYIYRSELNQILCLDIDPVIIPDLIESFHDNFLNSQFCIIDNKLKRNKSKHYLKEFGAVYTQSEIANNIVTKCIDNVLKKNNIEELKCLDFACGTGRFYLQAVRILHEKYKLSLKDIICKHLFAVDIDEIAITILRLKICSLLESLDIDLIQSLEKNILCRNALIPNSTLLSDFDNCIDLKDDFYSIQLQGGFDIVFSNPPYYLLKVNKEKDLHLVKHQEILQDKITKEINYFKNSNFYQHSIEGMLNYYKLSIEMIVYLTKPLGQIGVICPSSLFGDLSSTKLRRFLLMSNKLLSIRYYSEGANLFDNVAQSTTIFHLEKAGRSEKIDIEIEAEKFAIPFSVISSIFVKNLEVPFIDEIGWKILEILSKHKRLKEIYHLRNRRGELDLTLYKDCILDNTSRSKSFRLVRGNMIKESGIIDKNDEFVDIDKFLNRKSDDYKNNDFNVERLICQQISNIDSSKRLNFVLSDKNDIIANSCNYITTLRGSEDQKKLLYILNSQLLNWRFKVTSSNNHINNYELDELPLLNLDDINVAMFSDNQYDNDIQICRLYGLNTEETSYILKNTSK